MAKKPDNKLPDVADGKIDDIDKHVFMAYHNQIKYYREKAGYNKKSYKSYRFLTILLGAVVTLIASLTTSDIIQYNKWIEGIFTIATPVLAAALTVINSISQNFQWGATWRDMSINAQKLEKERDLLLTTPLEKRDYKKEMKKLNNIVLQETQAFFTRILDSEVVPTESPYETESEEEE